MDPPNDEENENFDKSNLINCKREIKEISRKFSE